MYIKDLEYECRFNYPITFNRPFQLTFKICAEYVTSRLGCLGRLAGANFPLLYTGT